MIVRLVGVIEDITEKKRLAMERDDLLSRFQTPYRAAAAGLHPLRSRLSHPGLESGRRARFRL